VARLARDQSQRRVFPQDRAGSRLDCNLDWSPFVLIAVLTFDVLPDKRLEFAGAVTCVVQTIRWSTGCLGCRLVTDCENRNLFTFISEWDGRPYLDGFLASYEFQVLEGTRFLLHGGPSLSIDEVISRGRLPGPVRPPS
jgi:quinol monooxygenase YgiN